MDKNTTTRLFKAIHFSNMSPSLPELQEQVNAWCKEHSHFKKIKIKFYPLIRHGAMPLFVCKITYKYLNPHYIHD